MRRNDEIQEAIIAYLKANSEITTLLTDGADEIREDQWQGSTFTYPNIRVRLSSTSSTNISCDAADINFSIYVFSEDASSWQADKIAGIIVNVLGGNQGKQFATGGLNFNLRVSTVIPAIRSDKRTWRSEVILRGRVSG